jgi:2-methylisocitrate lyase-like PEP mutase family enzyme
MATATELRTRFRGLHADGCFVLPNPWDVGSTRMLETFGFSAIATSSAGLGFTKGVPDIVDVRPLGAVLDHVHALVEAVALPINVDFQNGYAHAPDGVADNVTQLIAIGIAGLSIEDASGKRDEPDNERSWQAATSR